MGPPHAPGRQGARRAVRPRREAPPHVAARPRVRRGDPPRRHERRSSTSTSATAPRALPWPRPIQRDPIKDTFEHVDLIVVRRGEKVTVEIPVTLVGEAARDTLVMTEHDTLAVSPRRRTCPTTSMSSIEGLEVGSQVQRGRRQAARGRRAGRPTRTSIVVIVSRGADAEQLEGETAEAAEAEAAEASRPSAGAGARAGAEAVHQARPRRTGALCRHRRGMSTVDGPVAGGRAGQPRPGVREATGTTSASWSPTCSPPGSARVRPAPPRGRRGRRGPARLGGPRLVLAKPLTYMNLSGGPVAGLAQFYKVPVEQIVAVHDELDLPCTASCGSSSAAARAATTACARCPSRWAPRTTCGCGSASAARPGGRTRPTTCCRTSPRSSARSWSSSSTARPTRSKCCLQRGLEWTQNQYHATLSSPPIPA